MIGAIGTPPMKRMPKAMQLSTRAVPMSGCLRIRIPEMPSTARTGTMTMLRLAGTVDPTGQQVGGEDGQGQLHQLRRLQLEHADADPPRRASGRHPEVGHEHHDQQGHGADAPGEPGWSRHFAVVDPRETGAGRRCPRPSRAPGG